MGFRFWPESTILRSTMNTVPRLRDTVAIYRDGPDSFRVKTASDAPGISLSASGYDLLCRMDGVSDERSVREAFGRRWDTSLSREELKGWLSELQRAGAFVRDSRAIAALSHLRDQGITFRGGRSDRRLASRPSDRRQGEGGQAGWFDHAVILLNDGYVEQSSALFDRFAAEAQGDLRVQELACHLQSIVRDELPEVGERRDVTWAVFDEALHNFLDGGACPSCGGGIDIEVGDLNRCYECGASFSSFVLGRSEDERRSS
jgi:hypothetical protein